MAKESKKDAKVRRQLYREIVKAMEAGDYDAAYKAHLKYYKKTGRSIRAMANAIEHYNDHGEWPGGKKTKKETKKAGKKKASKAGKNPGLTRGKTGSLQKASRRARMLPAHLPERVREAIKKLEAARDALAEEIDRKSKDMAVYANCIENLVKGFRKGKKKKETAEE